MIGYKIASSEGKRVLVTLEIPSDANTNLDRKRLKDKMCAKYRCDKAFVLCIEDEEGKKYKSASTSIFSFKKIKYVLEEEIFEKDYNKDVNVVCGEGIHFFLSKEVALLYGLDKIENGEYKEWYSNGQLEILYNYKEGKLEGEYKSWFKNGNQWEHTFYKDSNLEGEYKSWFKNGKLHIDCHYKEGKLEGKYKQWDEKGNLIKDEVYVNGSIIN